MDEQNTTVSFDDADLDAEWGAEGDFEAADEAQTPEADQPVGEQQPADQSAATETNTDPAQQEDTQQSADKPELFTIRYRGQDEQLTREQLIMMAQKGRDYDTVRTERDTLKADQETNAGAVALVQSYAQRMNMTVPQYLNWVKTQELMKSGMSEQQAAQTVQMDQRKAELDAQEARIKAQNDQRNSLLQQARERREARAKDVQTFFQAYPEVDPKAITSEVWEKVNSGVPLAAAYAMHENARLKAENAALQQNKTNQQRTPGSLGANSGAELDEFDRYWNEDD